VNEVQQIYLEIYEKIFPNKGEIKNEKHNKIDREDTDKNIFFDKYMKRFLKSFNKDNQEFLNLEITEAYRKIRIQLDNIITGESYYLQINMI